MRALKFLKRLAKSKFRKNEEGVTALEFALLGPVFFAIIFSIFEIGVTFTKMTMLHNAVGLVAKQIYVGNASTGVVTYDDLEEQICESLIIAGEPNECKQNIVLELTKISTIADLPDDEAVCEYKDLAIKPVVKYEPGGSSETVFIRVCWVTDIMMPGIGYGLQIPRMGDDKFAIVSATAFINEPF